MQLNGRQYLASFAGTIHAGWSVYFFRPIERMSIYRLTGITGGGAPVSIGLLFWGSNFYVRERAALSRASVGLYRALFEAVPEAILLADPQTHQILETNTAWAEKLGYPKEDLLGQRLETI